MLQATGVQQKINTIAELKADVNNLDNASPHLKGLQIVMINKSFL